MARPKRLWKTTIVIWTDYNPFGELSGIQSLQDLAREAEVGDAFCSEQKSVAVTDPEQFPETEFFDIPED